MYRFNLNLYVLKIVRMPRPTQVSARKVFDDLLAFGGRTFGVRRCGRGQKHGRTHVRHPPIGSPLGVPDTNLEAPGGDALSRGAQGLTTEEIDQRTYQGTRLLPAAVHLAGRIDGNRIGTSRSTAKAPMYSILF